MPFAKPLARTREYVQIVRDIFARDGPVTSDGPHYPLPLAGRHRPRQAAQVDDPPACATDIPIFLGAEGPKNIALAAEICDGWLALFYSPYHEDFYRDALAEGFAREGARRSPEDFEVVATVPVIVHDDVEQAR